MRRTEVLAQPDESVVGAELGPVEAEVLLHQVFDEVILFPGIGFRTKGRGEFEVFGRTGVEESVELFEHAAIVGLAQIPRLAHKGEKVFFAQVFHQGDVAPWIVIEDVGDVDTVLPEKAGDGEEIAVVLAVERVVDADEGGVPLRLETNDGAP